MTLIIHLLGSIQISRDNQPISLRGYKTTALLAYLLLTSKAHTRRHLIDLLFDGPADPKASLRWILSQLRQAIGPEFVLADRQQIAFNFDSDYWLDVAAFEAGQINLYQGDFLEGLNVRDAFGFEEWASFERERLRKQYQTALIEQLEKNESLGNDIRVVETAQQLLRLDNFQEVWHRALMRTYARQGQREAALAQFNFCRRILKEELGTEPAKETVALAEQIQAGTPEAPILVSSQSQDTLLTRPAFLEPSNETSVDTDINFVAREEELIQLNNFFDLALAGQSRVVFVTGDPGSGKTALVQEFSQRIQATQPELIVAGGVCNAFTGVGDPYLPFREALSLLAGEVETRGISGTISRDQAQRLWALMPQTIQTLMVNGPDLLDIFISSSSLIQRGTIAAPGGANWLSQLIELVTHKKATSPPVQLQQANLFEQYTKVIQALAQQQPILLILDDLQWADAGSINLLFHLGQRLKGQRILIIGIYRPADVALGRPTLGGGGQERHPLEAVVNEFQRNFGQIHIDLNKIEGYSFIKALLDTEPHQLDLTFQEALYQHAQGHALFTIEMLRGMQERGDLVQDDQGRWIEGPTLNWEILPARIEGIIGERIGRLPPKSQQILQIASIEGEVFTAEVIAQTQGISEPEVVRQLSGSLDRQHRLVRSQGSQLLTVEGQRVSHYHFRHILFQRYLYSTMDDTERSYLHQAVGTVLEQLYEGQPEEIAVQLAWHFQQAGLVEKAIGYLQQAGDRAVRLSAYEEAINHFTQAITLLETLATHSQHAQQELNLQIALGQALYVVKGTGSPEVERAWSRARELCEQLGETKQLFLVLYGLVTYNVMRGDIRQTASTLGEQCLQLAQSQQDSTLLIGAYILLGTLSHYLGEFAPAQIHFERGLALYDPQQSATLVSFYGHDPGVYIRRYLAWTSWELGYPEQALEHVQAAVDLAKELSHSFSLVGALGHACVILGHCREAQACLDQAEETITTSIEQGAIHWQLIGTMWRGWALAEQGQVEGIEQIRQGLKEYQAVGARATSAIYLTMLANAYLKFGQVTEGLITVKEALTEMDTIGEGIIKAEAYRLKGELLKRDGAGEGEVEQQFLKAIDIARQQSAKSWELRATVSLCLLWQAQGKRAEAGQMLSNIYNWFTEGFDRVDLKEAKQLLEDLS